jgi:hypothetical protein
MNYEHKEDIDPPNINDLVEYDETSPYNSDTEDSLDDNADFAAAQDDRASFEPNFEAMPHEQDDSNDKEKDSSDKEGAQQQDKNNVTLSA